MYAAAFFSFCGGVCTKLKYYYGQALKNGLADLFSGYFNTRN
jgi:hypothetical protein